MGLIAGYSHSGAGGFLLPFGVDDIDTYCTAWQGTAKEDIGLETAVGLCVNRHAADVLYGLCHDKDWAPDAAKVPVVGATLSHIYLCVGAFLGDLHL